MAKACYVLTYTFFICYGKLDAMTLRYESPFSYGIVAGLDVFDHPQKPDAFIENHPACTKTQRFFPGGGVFVDYRLFNSISFGLASSYTNRGFCHVSDVDQTRTITNAHFIDLALIFSILPKGLGGVSFYGGPIMYFLLNSDSSEFTYTGKKANIARISERFVKRNIGVVLGLKIEIDRTGFIVGAEVEKFFKPMQIVMVMPEIYHIDPKYEQKKDEWEYEGNKNAFSAFGWRIYIGYDFGRLHSGY